MTTEDLNRLKEFLGFLFELRDKAKGSFLTYLIDIAIATTEGIMRE